MTNEWNKDQVIASVREDLKHRSEFGLQKYGKPISDRVDILHKGWVQHLYEELLDAANYCKTIMMTSEGFFRRKRQQLALAWCRETFGDENALDHTNRALIVLEEALELYQACGGDYLQAVKVAHGVFANPAGATHDELGDLLCAAAICAEVLGVDGEEAEQRGFQKCLNRNPENLRRRLAAKQESGQHLKV